MFYNVAPKYILFQYLGFFLLLLACSFPQEIVPADPADTWSLVGDAAQGWDTDIELSFDVASQTWRLAKVTLKAGKFKFRKNSDYKAGQGGRPARNTLTVLGGNELDQSNGSENFVIAATNGGAKNIGAGDYQIILDLTSNKVKLRLLSSPAYTWSLVGDAAQGWDTDIELSFDAASQTWRLANVTLKTGEFKFRKNKGWAVSQGWGGDNADGTKSLESLGHTNFTQDTAGMYDIELDLIDGWVRLTKKP